MNQEDRELVKLGRALEDLVRQDGWKELQGIIERRINSEHGRLIKESRDIGDVLLTEYVKGTIYGLVYARDLAQTTIEQAREVQKRQSGAEE